VEVQFTPEEESALGRLAASAGVQPERLVKDAALRLLSSNGVSVLAEMRALREGVKPDPEGWTTRDYVVHGRS
jgi:hypothetical protein